MPDENTTVYDVVVNEQDQYSLWAGGTPLPGGWRAEGFSGPKDACLSYIDRTWTAMQPPGTRQPEDEGTAT
ncbi:MbtH family NRPS accessory protein [Streptomyces sp. NPDC032940]|uniref:MbtH family protein n=1 Tax=Streptomyces sp. NPDC032940 TaxID=3155366 RepID=UPI0033DF7582